MNTFTMPDGRELHFFYSIGVLCDYSDFVLRNPSGDVSVARATIKKAVLMHKAYIDATGSEETPVTEKEIASLPLYAFAELQTVLDAQEKADSERKIEADPKKAKNAVPKK